MSNNFSKLAFLVVLVVVVLFSRVAYPAMSLERIATSTQTGIQTANVPLFTIPSVSVSADPTAGIVVTDTIAVSPASQPPVGGPIPPALTDAAYLVADVNTGTIYASRNPDKRWPTASLTKLMNATVVLDNMDMSAKITITPEMFAVDPADETNLVQGGTYSVGDLLHAMLLPSSNVAAEALADFYGHDQFIAKMNANAAAWGMTSTYFNDPSGLSAANQSTANDFLKLAQKISATYPQIFSVTRTPQYAITEQNSGAQTTLKSINDFAGALDFVGGKTGHTDEAAGNLLSVFHYDDHQLFIVVLGTESRFIDTQKLYNWFKVNFK